MIYIITARSEIDLIDIKEEFQAKYNVSLGERIKVGIVLHLLLHMQIGKKAYLFSEILLEVFVLWPQGQVLNHTGI